SGARARLTATGSLKLETGSFYSGAFTDAEGEITIESVDFGGRWSPLPPHDQVNIDASIRHGDDVIEVRATRPIVEDPRGMHTTWWGVGQHVTHHGDSGIGTTKLPPIHSELAVFALGTIRVNGSVVADGVPVHVMTSARVTDGFPGTLELDAGMEGVELPQLPGGHVRAVWARHSGTVPQSAERARNVGGTLVLLALLAGAFVLVRREQPTRR
ncbi:MAG TPA: hypothetical protein VM600_07185, partial [Actinomycetota bacterium]|nr:hypothetical protein [Actinomycetota bacterium]